MLESILGNVIGGAALLLLEIAVKALFKKYQATKEYQKLTFCAALILLAASISLVIAVIYRDSPLLLLLFSVPFVFGIVVVLMAFRGFAKIALDAVAFIAGLHGKASAEESSQHDEQTVR
jgi:hypothetical protein